MSNCDKVKERMIQLISQGRLRGLTNEEIAEQILQLPLVHVEADMTTKRGAKIMKFVEPKAGVEKCHRL